MTPSPAHPVLWTDDLDLLPQQFQHLQAHLRHHADSLAAIGRLPHHGLLGLEIDTGALNHGHLGLRGARGVLPDGTPFDLPSHQPAPPPVALGAADEGVVFVLAVARGGVARPPEEGGSDAATQGARRYRRRLFTLADDMSPDPAEPEPVALGVLELRLVRLPEVAGQDVALPVARVARVLPNGQALLDETFVPPLLDLRASRLLHDRLEALLGVLRHRADWQTARLGQPQNSSMLEVSDFVLLQSLLRHEAALALALALPRVPPLAMLRQLQALVADLSALRHPPERARPVAWTPDTPLAMFAPLLARAEHLLNQMRERLAIELDFRLESDGLRVATELLPPLGGHERLVLAVHAQVPEEWLYRRFATQAIVGAADRLAELVRVQVPGVGLRHLATAPAELPLQSGWHYFELEPGGAAWHDMVRSRAMGLHVAGNWPGLALRGWIVRPAPAPAPASEARDGA